MKETNNKLSNLEILNRLFKHNKLNIENLIKDTEQITGCNLRSRSSSERTYFAYERIYLQPEEVIEASKSESLPEQKNNTDIKATSDNLYYKEIKTNNSGYMDAHIENTYNAGEKYYHLMTADKDQTVFITKFYDRPIATVCFTDSNILYIPADNWTKIDKKSYENILREMGDKYTTWGSYNESTYIAINRNLKFDANGIISNPFKSVELNLSDKSQYETDMYIGRPNFKGYTGHSASYKNGEKANKVLLCISPLMGEEALSENSYAKSANVNRKAVNKSILEKGYFYNKKRGDIAVDGEHKDIINQMAFTIGQVKEIKLKADIYPVLLDFIISKHIDFNKKTVGIRTARRECNLLEELERFLGK